MVWRMNNRTLVYVSVFLLSAAVLSFEIVVTRITSVVFVQNYAFIILALALLGIGGGGVVSYFGFSGGTDTSRTVHRLLFVLGVSLCLFITATIALSITHPVVFFLLVILPFLLSGMVYAQLYRAYATSSFRLYASDLSGAAVGAVGSLWLIGAFGAPNSIVVAALVVFAVSGMFLHSKSSLRKRIVAYSILILSFAALIINGRHEFLGTVPIGEFPEKDFYHVYSNVSTTPLIIDSRWSVYGRSDLVRYSHQDMVRQLFVDGAGGTQVYRFNGNVQNTQSILQELLLRHTNAIPFLCMQKHEKRSMLVIGPGGGKEVLLGLFGEAEAITAVEINPDLVEIVNDHREFDGGIYSDFPNVKVVVEEGRHFVRKSREAFDLIVMALPSTEQMQNIEPFATSENYLLTREAIEDYLERLTPEGRLILTVHNDWELMRLVATTVVVFQGLGVAGDDIKNHFAVLEAEYAPTVVVKKRAFTRDETMRWENIGATVARDLPAVTYLPYGKIISNRSAISQFLARVTQSPDRVREIIRRSKDDISPCTDDRPYFYKKSRGVPGEYLWLLSGTIGINALVVWLPFRVMRRRSTGSHLPRVALPLALFACIGIGFMMVEVSLFQKLVLYLGSPTISLAILLSSLLVGMGSGSYFGRSMFREDVRRRLHVVSIAIVVAGSLLFAAAPGLLEMNMEFGLPLRASTTFLMLLPFAFLLGVPFPSCIQLVAQGHGERYIPWMYGVNGSMSVLGSVLAVIVSMLVGFTPAFFTGLAFYLGVFLISFASSGKGALGSVTART